MRDQSELSVIGGSLVLVGLSAIIKLNVSAYQYAMNFKIQAGGGTLEVVNPPAALTGSSAIGWGKGYPVGANEIISVSSPAVVYLAATGATMTVAAMLGYTTGATVT